MKSIKYVLIFHSLLIGFFFAQFFFLLWCNFCQTRTKQSNERTSRNLYFYQSCDEPRRRPKEAVPDENIKKVYKIILDARKMRSLKIANNLRILKKWVGHIFHKYLELWKRMIKSKFAKKKCVFFVVLWMLDDKFLRNNLTNKQLFDRNTLTTIKYYRTGK